MVRDPSLIGGKLDVDEARPHAARRELNADALHAG